MGESLLAQKENASNQYALRGVMSHSTSEILIILWVKTAYALPESEYAFLACEGISGAQRRRREDRAPPIELSNFHLGVSTSNPEKRTGKGMRTLADLLRQLPKQKEKQIAKHTRVFSDRSSLPLTTFHAPLQAYSLAYRTVFRV